MLLTLPLFLNSWSKVQEVVLNMQHLPIVGGFKMNKPTLTSEKKNN